MLQTVLLIIGMLAQTPDPLTGGAGWVGAGLLGAVLCWMFFVRIPATDRMLEAKDERLLRVIEGNTAAMAAKDVQLLKVFDAKDKQMQLLIDVKHQLLKDMALEFKSSLKEVAGHCERELAQLASFQQSQMGQLVSAMEDITEKMDALMFGKGHKESKIEDKKQ